MCTLVNASPHVPKGRLFARRPVMQHLRCASRLPVTLTLLSHSASTAQKVILEITSSLLYLNYDNLLTACRLALHDHQLVNSGEVLHVNAAAVYGIFPYTPDDSNDKLMGRVVSVVSGSGGELDFALFSREETELELVSSKDRNTEVCFFGSDPRLHISSQQRLHALDTWDFVSDSELGGLDQDSFKAILRAALASKLHTPSTDSIQTACQNRPLLLLLHGPNGCGKRSFARQLATRLTKRRVREYSSAVLDEMMSADRLSSIRSVALLEENALKTLFHGDDASSLQRQSEMHVVIIDDFDDFFSVNSVVSEPFICIYV